MDEDAVKVARKARMPDDGVGSEPYVPLRDPRGACFLVELVWYVVLLVANDGGLVNSLGLAMLAQRRKRGRQASLVRQQRLQGGCLRFDSTRDGNPDREDVVWDDEQEDGGRVPRLRGGRQEFGQREIAGHDMSDKWISLATKHRFRKSINIHHPIYQK